MSDVAIGKIVGIGLGVKSVAGGVAANESEALVDGVEKRLFARGRHWRIAVRAGLSEIAGGEKESGLVGMEFFGIEDASVLRAVHIKAILLAKFGDSIFGDAEIGAIALYDLMFKARRFGEYEDGFLCGGKEALRERQACCCGGDGTEKTAAIGIRGHETLH